MFILNEVEGENRSGYGNVVSLNGNINNEKG